MKPRITRYCLSHVSTLLFLYRTLGSYMHWLIAKCECYSSTEQGRLGIWALDGDPTHTSLLKYALTEENFEHTLVVLVASMTQPWSILDSLEKWASILRHHIDRLRMPPENRREYEQSCKLLFFWYQFCVHACVSVSNLTFFPLTQCLEKYGVPDKCLLRSWYKKIV